MPHDCGTSKPCQSAQTASSERAQCVSGMAQSVSLKKKRKKRKRRKEKIEQIGIPLNDLPFSQNLNIRPKYVFVRRSQSVAKQSIRQSSICYCELLGV
jgi:hypothetical protein